MKKFSYIMLLMAVLAGSAFATSPKHEFRATWLSTVWAIDWPSVRASSEDAERSQKAELRSKLDMFQELGLNACFFQVRGMSDAFYDSKYEPWSQYLTGKRGLAPTYDPMAYIIEEAHKRGIEVHAWVNPYRYATSSENYGTLPTDYSNTHPEWLIKGADAYILNPGIPEVREQIVKIIEDIIEKYDVDGIVFDDYFYLNGSTYDSTDSAQYRLYNPDVLSRGDWRRQNVNKMVADVNAAIKKLKPWVRFGIGPAGVAASNATVAAKYDITPCPAGSDWQYNGIYSEPVQWLKDNTIDYLSPQVYWTIGSTNDYSKIVPWWGMVAHKFGRHMYVSASLSSLSPVVPGRGMSEMEKQRMVAQTMYKPDETIEEIKINYSSAKEGAPGMVFFSAKNIGTAGFVDALLDGVWTEKALVPPVTWYKPEEQGLVTDIEVSGQMVSWQYDGSNVRYGVYAIPKTERHNIEALTSSAYYLGMTWQKSFQLPEDITESTHCIAVAVQDRYGNEYSPRFHGEAKAEKQITELLTPTDGSSVLLPCVLSWYPVSDVMSYTVQVATDKDFSNLIANSQTESNYLQTQMFSKIDGSDTYYWRVKAQVANSESEWSETRSFSGQMFHIQYPADGESDVDLCPEFRWDDVGEGTEYTLEIATEGSYFRNLVYSVTTTARSAVVPEKTVLYGTTYRARVIVQNYATTGTTHDASAQCVFTTKQVTMLPPVILAPVAESHVTGKSITARVDEAPNNGYQWELSESKSFPRTRYVDATDANVYAYTFEEDLRDGEYWLRVATITADGLTDYSEVVHFTYSASGTGVEQMGVEKEYVADGLLYAEPGTAWSMYTTEGRRVASGVTQAKVTHLPHVAEGVYVIRTDKNTIKYINK